MPADTIPQASGGRDPVWSFHNGCTGDMNIDGYYTAIGTQFGAPANLTQFCQRAQLINYETYKSSFEALQAKRFTGATGLMLWMSASCWPSVVWQQFDYYMEGTGGMYGAMHGAEPVHIMYYGPTGGYNVSVVNNTATALSNYTAVASTYNLNGTRQWTLTKTGVSVAADVAATNVLGTAITPGTSTPYFLDLKLLDNSGNLVSHNFYWLPDDYTVNISGIMGMNQAAVTQVANGTWTLVNTENTISLKIVNTSQVSAIACRLMLTGAASGARILPAHYNDNYFSLVPGDTQSVTVKFDEMDRGSQTPELCLTGVNVAQTCFAINGATSSRNDVVMGLKTSRLAVEYSGGRRKLFNVPVSTGWKIRLFDMLGRKALDAEGVAGSNSVIMAACRVTPGTYVATVVAGGEQVRAMLVVTGR